MAVSANWDPCCGCPCSKSPSIWGLHDGPSLVETPIWELDYMMVPNMGEIRNKRTAL